RDRDRVSDPIRRNLDERHYCVRTRHRPCHRPAGPDDVNFASTAVGFGEVRENDCRTHHARIRRTEARADETKARPTLRLLTTMIPGSKPAFNQLRLAAAVTISGSGPGKRSITFTDASRKPARSCLTRPLVSCKLRPHNRLQNAHPPGLVIV